MSAIAFFIPHAGCPQDCSFCNQRSISGVAAPPTLFEVREVLQRELEQRKEHAAHLEIAFFGGSFTAIPTEDYLAYLEVASEFCGENKFSGIRFSTRPDAITPQVITYLKKYPISHIELGVQSMDETVLLENRRGHTTVDVKYAVRLLKENEYLFTLQMMTGLMGSTQELDWKTAQQIAAFSPNSVRIYPTVVLEHTLLSQAMKEGYYQPPTFEDAVEQSAQLLLFFNQKRIPVIRLGLNYSDEMAKQVLAGPLHPAFRELCQGRALVKLCNEQLEILDGDYIQITVHTSEVSSLTGHHRTALKDWDQRKILARITGDKNHPILQPIVRK